jgi:tartrate dehydrogenase/decarboxylase/D-malate dehydrogenase
MKRFDIAVIPGDGIGREVVPAGCKILDTVAAVHGGFRFRYKSYPWSCAWYLKHGKMMPDDGLKRIGDSDAIFLGAVGFPGVADHISLWGLLIPIRRNFQQYACVRPVKLLPGVRSPLAGRGPQDIDFIVVRENNEGEYSSMGGRIYSETPHEVVTQLNLFTRRGTERIIRYAFDLARKRKKKVTSATKSNGIIFACRSGTRFGRWRRISGIAADRCISTRCRRASLHPQNFGWCRQQPVRRHLTDLGRPSPSISISGQSQPGKVPLDRAGARPAPTSGKGAANPRPDLSRAMMMEHLGIPPP